MSHVSKNVASEKMEFLHQFYQLLNLQPKASYQHTFNVLTEIVKSKVFKDYLAFKRYRIYVIKNNKINGNNPIQIQCSNCGNKIDVKHI